MANIKISDPSITDLNATDITDPTKIRFITADTQLGVPGTTKDIGIDQIAASVHTEIISAASHGLVSSDVGKPLSGLSIYDDTTADEVTWVLIQSIDFNSIRVAPIGAVVSIAVTLIEDGASYDVNAKGRKLYWDNSATLYKGTKPTDSHATAGVVLTVISVGASTFVAVVTPSQDVDSFAERLLTITNTAHGLGSSDLGKPIDTEGDVLNDTASLEFIGTLYSVVDANTLMVASAGLIVTIANTLLQNSGTWDLSSAGEGRFCDWDSSLGLYVDTVPADSHPNQQQKLMIESIGGSTFRALVLEGR